MHGDHGAPTGAPCGAKTRRGDPCTNPPVTGATRCRMHGGATPQSKQAATRRNAATRMQQAVITLGLRRDIGPTEALLEEVQWTAGHVTWLRGQVQELESGALVYGVASVVDKAATEFPGQDTTYEAAMNVWMALYQSERKHLVVVCKAAIDAGIAERQVRLAERMGEVLIDVVRGALVDAGLAAEQETVMRAVGARLRLVS